MATDEDSAMNCTFTTKIPKIARPRRKSSDARRLDSSTGPETDVDSLIGERAYAAAARNFLPDPGP